MGDNLDEVLLAIKSTLPGVSVIYYGEEIGMTNADDSLECVHDPAFDSDNTTSVRTHHYPMQLSAG